MRIRPLFANPVTNSPRVPPAGVAAGKDVEDSLNYLTKGVHMSPLGMVPKKNKLGNGD